MQEEKTRFALSNCLQLPFPKFKASFF